MSAPKLDTLPDRMRYAADVLEEATRAYFAARGVPEPVDHHDWRPVKLRYIADQMEQYG